MEDVFEFVARNKQLSLQWWHMEAVMKEMQRE